MRCPQCRDDRPKPLVATVRWKPVEEPVGKTHVLLCTGCGCRFYDDQKPPDYAEPSLLERGRVPFYVQQGAGLSLITRPLARLERPAGSTYMDVGCGFGFGLDFAIQARGWHGAGIDPSPLSSIGRKLLGVDIALRYLTGADAVIRRCDIVVSSETIEHVRSPRDFVRTLRWALAPGGVLVLTTPDGDAIRPDTTAGAIVPLLSPGLHLVFQNERSLRDLLSESGFVHIAIERDGMSLVAYASDAPIVLQDDPAVLRARYRDWLEARALACAPPDSRAPVDLFLGFAGRAVQESVNDGADAQAARVWTRFAAVCIARFGLDLDAPDTLPPAASRTTDALERLAEVMPINLAGMLYARGMMHARAGDDARAEASFAAAPEAAAVLRRALAAIAIDDISTEDIAWAARAEAVLAAARRGAADVPSRTLAMPPPPEGVGSPRAHALAPRALTSLLNAGHLMVAAELAERAGLTRAPWGAPDGRAPQSDPERDALYGLAVLDLLVWHQPARALARLARLRETMLDDPHAPARPLFAEALRTEQRVLAENGRAEDAASILAGLRARIGSAADAVVA